MKIMNVKYEFSKCNTITKLIEALLTETKRLKFDRVQHNILLITTFFFKDIIL